MNTLHITLLRLQIQAVLLAQRAVNIALRGVIALSNATLTLAGRLHTRINGRLTYRHASTVVALQIARDHHADQIQRGTTRLGDEVLEIFALIAAPALFALSVIDYIAGPNSGQLIALLAN